MLYTIVLYIAIKFPNIHFQNLLKNIVVMLVVGFSTTVAKLICDALMDKYIVYNWISIKMAVVFGLEINIVCKCLDFTFQINWKP